MKEQVNVPGKPYLDRHNIIYVLIYISEKDSTKEETDRIGNILYSTYKRFNTDKFESSATWLNYY